MAINYALGGLDVWGYHVFNLFLHILSALLLFGILRRSLTIRAADALDDPTKTWLAGAIALIWEVHPLVSEAVDYIVQRTELLAGLFLLFTLYCVIRGSSSGRPRIWFACAIVGCALGMCSKETMVSAPLVVLLYDRVFLSKSWAEVFRRRGFLHAALIGTWIIAAGLILTGARSETVGLGFSSMSPWVYARTQCKAILYYLRLSLLPNTLSIDYSDWPTARVLGDAAPYLAAILALLGLAVWSFVRKPWIGFLGVSFFLLLAPTSSFVPIISEVVAERRMYLPLATVVSLVAVTGYYLLAVRSRHQLARKLLVVLLGGTAVMLGFMTYSRNETYKTELSIWTDVVEKRPNNARAFNNLGSVYGKAGNIDAAIPCFQKAISINPDYPEALTNLGAALGAKGRIREAVKFYMRVIALAPQFAEAHYNLALALHQMGLLDEAESQYSEALRAKPDYAEAHNNLGVLLASRKRVAEAAQHFQEALRIRPDYPEAQKNLRMLR